MPLDFYFDPMSAPCLAVMLTCRALGLEVNVKKVSHAKGDTRTPEFRKINPQHYVPTIVDGDLTIWESRAINCYLVNQYGKDSSLYPKDPKTRAKIDHLLNFDLATIYRHVWEIMVPIFKGEMKEIPPAKLDSLYEVLGWLDGMLEGHKWSVGNNITIADFSLLADIQMLELGKSNLNKFKNILKWKENCKKEIKDYHEICSEPLSIWEKLMQEKFSKVNLWRD